MARLTAAAIRAARAGRGRWVALCVLAALCLPLVFPTVAPFERLQYAWLDFYQYAFPRERKHKRVVVVEIDEYTLHQVGEWPWPRTKLAELVQRIAESGAVAIGLDMILSEPDQTSPEALIPRLGADQREVIAALSAMTPNDARLADVMRDFGGVVIGMAGVDNPAFGDVNPLKNPILLSKTPVIVHGGNIEGRVRSYPYKLVSLVRFQQAAAGQGVINADLESGVLRRVPLVSTDGVAPLPALALELYRIATHASRTETPELDRHGLAQRQSSSAQ